MRFQRTFGSVVTAGMVCLAFAGCTDKKTTNFLAAKHRIDEVGARATDGSTGGSYIPHDGVDGAGTAITVNIEGDDFADFGHAPNLRVVMAEVTAGTFDTSVAGVTSGTQAFPFATYAVNHTLVHQDLITFVMPTVSPLLGSTGDVQIIVYQLNKANDTLPVPTGQRANDLLTLVASASVTPTAAATSASVVRPRTASSQAPLMRSSQSSAAQIS